MKQVVRLLRVIVCPAPSAVPSVDISVSGTGLPPSVVRSGVVQSSCLFSIRNLYRMTC